MGTASERKHRWYIRKAAHIATVGARVEKLRRKRMLFLIETKGGHCQQCGYFKCTAALDFHHRAGTVKLFQLSMKGMTKNWELILAELDKCDLLCANCHREEHAANWTKDIGELGERINPAVC